MYHRIEDFLHNWEYEAANTSKVIGTLTDASLSQAVAPGHRTLGRLAWHLAQSIPEMMSQTGLSVTGVDAGAPVPGNAATILKAYDDASSSLAREIKKSWNDGTLEIEDNMYGEKWKRGLTLTALVMHQAHHRGQMTVLMRQAGLKVPGIYGPAMEDWAAYGQPAPEV
jgi:uncharacterized damage-inducible protein DinB